jgi:predicted Zn finger-like uncharacterized protein
MKISCQACGAKYTIADEKVQGKIAKIRCKRCQATIVVNGPGTAAADASSGGGGAEAGATYTVNFAENDQRTMTLDEVVRAYQQGQVTHETYIWAEGMDDWLPLASVPALASAVAGRASLADAPPPEAGSVPAARLDGGRVRVDLFGDVSKAGAEPGDEGDLSATKTGARNEQSVLFSLQTLSGSSGPSKPTAPPAGATTAAADDSGLIDLAALAKAAGDQPAAPHAAAASPHLGLPMPMAQPPLGAPAVFAAPPILGPAMLETPAMSGSVAPPPKGKTGFYIVIAAALLGTAVVAGAAIIALTRPAADPNGVHAGPGVGTTVATATAEPPPTPPPADTADTTPVASATAAPTATTTATAARPRPTTPAARPPAATPAAPPAATPAKPPASPNSNCGCPPGDLNCAIKCSATKKK